MFIKHLSLRNFKTIKEADFNFKKGIICFTGDNGEGKSTVLHALILLLFNTTYEGTLKDSVRWGEKEFLASVDFEHEGISYSESLSYSLTKGSERILTNNNTGEVFKGSTASSKLAEIIDPEQAKAAMVSMENEQNLVTTTPSQRREYLKKIYSLEFKEELNKIAQDLTDLDSEVLKIQGKRSVLSEMTFDIKEEKELPDENVYNSAKKELRDIEAKLKELSKKEEKYRMLTREMASYKEEISKHSDIIDEYQRDILSKEKENKTNKAEIALLKNIDCDKLEASAIKELEESMEEQRRSLKELISKDEEELSKIPEFPSRVSKSTLDSLIKEETELSAEIKESSRKLEILKQGKCPTCGREISQDEAEKEAGNLSLLKEKRDSVSLARQAEQERVDGIIAKNEEIKESLSKWKSSLERHQQSFDSLEETLSVKRENISVRFKAERMKQESEIKSLESEIHMNEEAIESYQKLQEGYRKQISSMEDKVHSLEVEIAQFEDIESYIKDLENQKIEPQSIIKETEDILSYNNSIYAYNMEMRRKEKERDESLKEIDSKLESLNSRKAMIAVAKGIVQREFPSFVISRMVKSLSDYVNEFLEKVYPKYKITIEESKNSLNILYGDYKTDVKMASGFEKSAFSLAYMYALGKIQAYGLLICDEGDSTASDENSAKFYRMLGKSTDWLTQIMCITHKEEIKELLKNDFHAQVFTVRNGEYREEIA